MSLRIESTAEAVGSGRPRDDRRSDEYPIVRSIVRANAAADAIRNEHVMAVLLGGVAGYVDAAGFFALFGLFTAHLTGQLATTAEVLDGRVHSGLTVHLAMVPVFILSVAGSTLYSRTSGRRGHAPLTSALGLMTSALAVFCLAGVALGRYATGPDAWAVAIIGATAVASMGIQNTLMRGPLRNLCPTTVMTGNITQLTMDLLELALPAKKDNPDELMRERAEALRRLVKFGAPLFGFTLGALLGAWLTAAVGLASVALPTLAVAALTVVTARAQKTKEAEK